jgi:hypothetical protein
VNKDAVEGRYSFEFPNGQDHFRREASVTSSTYLFGGGALGEPGIALCYMNCFESCSAFGLLGGNADFGLLNRVDYYSEDVDQIKITNYGMYMFNMLGFDFTYLDLICTDCGIFDQEASNYLSEAARIEYGHFIKRHSLKRVEIRLERVERFNSDLRGEELREREMYSLGMPEAEMFTSRLLAMFEAEKSRILRSAKKQEMSRKKSRG